MVDAHRFWSNTTAGEGCWEWDGLRDPEGYGRYHSLGSSGRAHRVAYELTHGPIPDGLTIDHLCQNKGCVNPEHLEPVTISENLARRVWSDTCPAGHAYDERNTHRRANGGRECRQCMAARSRAYRAARRAT
jgi:hypothetical protein